jgi:2TM domain-containing protein
MVEDPEMRQLAIKRLKEKRDFKSHLLAYLLVNAVLVVIWAMTTPSFTFFWPAFPMLGWGIGLVFHAWNVYGTQYSEEQVRREIEHLQGPRGLPG